MTDRHSTESKGYSYVKFKRASTAALAMETINETGRLGTRSFLSSVFVFVWLVAVAAAIAAQKKRRRRAAREANLNGAAVRRGSSVLRVCAHHAVVSEGKYYGAVTSPLLSLYLSLSLSL